MFLQHHQSRRVGLFSCLSAQKDAGVEWGLDDHCLISLTVRDAYSSAKVDECLDVFGGVVMLSTLGPCGDATSTKTKESFSHEVIPTQTQSSPVNFMSTHDNKNS